MATLITNFDHGNNESIGHRHRNDASGKKSLEAAAPDWREGAAEVFFDVAGGGAGSDGDAGATGAPRHGVL